jgi:hypothetical protein
VWNAPGEHVLRVARDALVDMVALGWSQTLDEGHATVVRAVLAGSSIPVLLVPNESPSPDDPAAGRLSLW